jgi:hypothetical protein
MLVKNGGTIWSSNNPSVVFRWPPEFDAQQILIVSVPIAARQSRWESRDNQDENAPLLG